MNTQKEEGEKRHRESNIELYRIICMILIVAHHYVVNSGLIAEGGPILTDPKSLKSIFLLLFGAWGKTGINCFVFITGWFMCKSKISLNKFVRLIAEVMFYKIVIYCIFLISGYESFDIVQFIKTIAPVLAIENNFTGCFLMYYLSIPFVNMLMDCLEEKKHLHLMLLISFVYIFFGTLHKVIMNYFSWFIVLHLIAGFMRRYPKAIYDKKNVWAFVSVISILLSNLSVICIIFLGTRFGLHGEYYTFVSDSNTLLAVVNGISSFLFFKNLKIRYSSMINSVAGSTFGVLLIHANSDSMRRWLWKDVLNNVGMYNSSMTFIHAIGSCLGIFACCVVIDRIRIFLFEKPFMKWWDMQEDNIIAIIRKSC